MGLSLISGQWLGYTPELRVGGRRSPALENQTVILDNKMMDSITVLRGDTNGTVSHFDALQRCEGAFGYDRHRQSMAAASVTDFRPELTQQSAHGSGRILGSWHYYVILMLHYIT